MSSVTVECYAGYRGEQRPMRFTLDGRLYQVVDIEDQWYSPKARYFRVRADDGNLYVLRHDETCDQWTLHALRSNKR